MRSARTANTIYENYKKEVPDMNVGFYGHVRQYHNIQ